MPYKKPSILIVDDYLGIHVAIEELLEDAYDLGFAESTKMAWEMIFHFKQSFDLIILDIVMPETDGIDLLRRIRELNPYLPVLIITAHDTHDRAKDACNLNVAGYIEKLHMADKLQERIRAITDHNGNGLMIPSGIHPYKTNNFSSVTIRCLDEIHKKFHTSFTNDDIALTCGVSKQHLCNLFKKDCGVTIREYIIKLRIETAKRLLKTSSYTVSDIQELVGYNNRPHFFNTFKEMTGMSPLNFRKMSSGSDSDKLEPKITITNSDGLVKSRHSRENGNPEVM